MRDRLCRNGTASGECAVPIAGFPLGSADIWCETKFGSTECLDIKEEVPGQKLLMAARLMGFLSITRNSPLNVRQTLTPCSMSDLS